jgi:SAM-dependent methyltransferase
MPAARPPALTLVADRADALARLDLGGGVWSPYTRALLEELALPYDARVLEVDGDSAPECAGAGADGDAGAAGSYDLVHARFVLARGGRAAERLAAWRRLLAPGGVLLVEEPDTRSWTYEPHAPAATHLIGRVAQAVSAGGGNLDAGRRLPALMRDAGLRPQVRTHALGLESGHPHHRLPLDLADALAGRLANVLGRDGAAQLRRQAAAELGAPGRRGTTFTLVQAWARAASR